MKLKPYVLASAACAALVVTNPLPSKFGWLGAQIAEAAEVSLSVNVFYDQLAPYGDWVSYDGSYVFVPTRVPDRWRPYTEGRWAYTRQYGWLWASDEPFGWATYHYGRWGFAPDIGWYWVPGGKWAPAWVSWRQTDDYVVWAPLPPKRGSAFSIDMSFGDVPDDYWVAVPAHRFLDANLAGVVLRDDYDRRRVVKGARPIGNVAVQNNVVVNNVIQVDFIEKKTKKVVKEVEVKNTNDPKKADRGDGNSIAVVNADVKDEPDAKPAKTADRKQTKKVQSKSEDGKANGDAKESGEKPLVKTKGQEPGNVDAATDEMGKASNLKEKAHEPKAPPAGKAQSDKKPENAAAKKVATPQTDEGEPSKAQDQKQPSKKNKSEKKKKQLECDPATDAECPPVE